MKHTPSKTSSFSFGVAASRLILGTAGAAMMALTAAARSPYTPVDSNISAPAARPESGVSPADIALPAVPNFTLRNAFHSEVAEDALAVSRCVYTSGIAEIDFSMRIYSGGERAMRALNEDVTTHLKNGGSITSREFGRTAAGEFIEVARCARNEITWIHWVIGDKKYVAATRAAGAVEGFLAACSAWNASPRVQWQCDPFPAYQRAAEANLPLFFYFFEQGGYCDDLERNALASAEFNTRRDRAVFIAFEPGIDDASQNRAIKMRELKITRVPTVVMVQIKPDGFAEVLRMVGYITPQQFNLGVREELDRVAPAKAIVPQAPLVPQWKPLGTPGVGTQFGRFGILNQPGFN
jgi:hypothetical protein